MASEAKPRQVIVYADAKGKEPFTEWLYSLRDIMGRKRILARVTRLAWLAQREADLRCNAAKQANVERPVSEEPALVVEQSTDNRRPVVDPILLDGAQPKADIVTAPVQAAKPVAGFALFARREEEVRRAVTDKEAAKHVGDAECVLPEAVLPAKTYIRRRKSVDRNVAPIGFLIESNIIDKGDTLSEAAKKVAALVNNQPAVAAKNGQSDLEESTIKYFLAKPHEAFIAGAVSISLSAYRIWQAIDEHMQLTGMDRISRRLSRHVSCANAKQRN